MSDEKWQKFVLTGSVMDYLDYTACTVEGMKERDGENSSDGTCALSSSDWGIRSENDDTY